MIIYVNNTRFPVINYITYAYTRPENIEDRNTFQLIIWVPKPDKDIKRKKNYTSISFTCIDLKFLNKLLSS